MGYSLYNSLILSRFIQISKPCNFSTYFEDLEKKRERVALATPPTIRVHLLLLFLSYS